MLPEDIPATQLTYGSHILDSHTSEPPTETIARVMYYNDVIKHWGRGLSMIFEECERTGLQQSKVTVERGVVRVTFLRPNLSGHRNDPINDPINDTINGTINDTINDTIRHSIFSRLFNTPGNAVSSSA